MRWSPCYVGPGVSLASPPLYRDNRSKMRAGEAVDPRRKLAEGNRLESSPLEEVGDVVLRNRTVEAPWRSCLAQQIGVTRHRHQLP